MFKSLIIKEIQVKLYWNIISHLQDWQKLKNLSIYSIGQGWERKKSFPHTADMAIRQRLTNLHLYLHSDLAIPFLGVHYMTMFHPSLSNPTSMNLTLKYKEPYINCCNIILKVKY